MDKKALTAALAAFGLGVGLLQLYMHNFELHATGGEKIPVLIVTKDAQAGQLLVRDMLGVREVPEAYFESRHIRARDEDRVLGQRLAVSGKANEALLWTDLASMGAHGQTLAALVQEGLRAVTVRTSQGSFADMLRPGDRVDVLAVSRGDLGLGTARGARTLLENILVLTVGNTVVQANDERAAHGSNASDVTVSVTSEQGRALAEAETQGSLRLLLRNPEDILTNTANQAPEAPVARSADRARPSTGLSPTALR